jgi:hypothetical protein
VGKADSSAHGLMPVHLNQLQKVETVVLKWVIMDGLNLNFDYPVCDCLHMCLHVYVHIHTFFNACCTRCMAFWDVLAF